MHTKRGKGREFVWNRTSNENASIKKEKIQKQLLYIDLHKLHNRALPSKFCLYRHSLLLYKVFNNEQPKNEWIDLNFQLINTRRQSLFEIQNSSTYRVGNNILSNRLSCLNRLISLNMLNLSFEGFKMKCKNQFLMPPTATDV